MPATRAIVRVSPRRSTQCCTGPSWAGKAVLATVFFMIGCVSSDAPRNVRGVFTRSFEHMDFRECGAWSDAWLKWEDAATGWEKVRGALRPGKKGDSAYIEMTARVEGPGRYGHLGKYWYEITPVSVSMAKQEAPPQCGG